VKKINPETEYALILVYVISQFVALVGKIMFHWDLSWWLIFLPTFLYLVFATIGFGLIAFISFVLGKDDR
jgi:hypothetical protein